MERPLQSYISQTQTDLSHSIDTLSSVFSFGKIKIYSVALPYGTLASYVTLLHLTESNARLLILMITHPITELILMQHAIINLHLRSSWHTFLH